MRLALSLLLAIIAGFSFSQTNITISNANAQGILMNTHNPATYTPTVWIDDPTTIINGLISDVSPDSMHAWLETLDSFGTRNSGSDTSTTYRGIGAARKWIHSKFEQFSARNDNRLEVGYLDFEAVMCYIDKHKNVFAMLPGLDPSTNDFLLIEAHFDSRCETNCDTACYAPGMEDNGSGTVMVMELARVLSKYAFDRTIVFTTVTGEEQGLIGGSAWADYISNNSIPFMACLNNDVVGGVLCGPTSSPPSCPGTGERDSTSFRVFSYSFQNDSAAPSQYKQLARYVKLQQIEAINPMLSVPMTIDLQIREDRQGRGGDHIPFRQNSLNAIRFCAAHEHGNGSGGAGDRQHTVNDILGVDTDFPPDGIIDSFFVDFNYLRRNVITNGVNLGLLANSPVVPNPLYVPLSDGVEITLTGLDTTFAEHRVGIRSKGSGTLYFDEVRTFSNTNTLTVNGLQSGKTYYFSVANVNAEGIESLFTEEFTVLSLGMLSVNDKEALTLGQNYPNPFKESTTIFIQAESGQNVKKAHLVFYDMVGKEVGREAVLLLSGGMLFTYTPPAHLKGTIYYGLEVDGLRTNMRTMLRHK